MAIATMTLMDVAQIPEINLFEPLPFMDYEHVQREIMDTYAEREIAYETPSLFRIKLNNALRLRCDSYNKMLRSQLIELDPFVTEYLEEFDEREEHGRNTDHSNRWRTETQKDDSSTVSNRDTLEHMSQTGNEDDKVNRTLQTDSGEDETTHVTDNRNTDTTSSETDRRLVHTTGADTTHTDDVTNQTTETNSTTDLDENTTVHSDQTTNTDVKSTDNQTGLNWTEQGSSQGHNLSVHSDAPQALLYNEPNHYYGTGRAHDYGEVKTATVQNDPQDPSKGTHEEDYYEHYPEFEPSQIDANSYKIGGFDTPWYNYATTADNNTGHDSYNKSGTETYQRSGSNDTDTTYGEDTSTDHNAKTTFTETATSNTDEDIDTKRSYTEDVTDTNTISKTGNENMGEETQTQRNLKGNVDTNEWINTVKDTTTDSNTTGNEKSTSGTTSTKTGGGSEGYRGHKHTDVASNRATVRKGRTMRSPADLLASYRNTLTFNADMWLLGELRPLFLELY